MNVRTILNEYRPALYFLGIFIGLYLILNTLYGLYITLYLPETDPITLLITQQVGSILAVFHNDVTVDTSGGSVYIPLLLSGKVVVNVFEGCNGINVMIVFVSFLIAFTGKLKSSLLFFGGGIILIYLMNLLRVTFLFEVALNFPEHLYFVHKFLFTGFIYAVVFIIWFFWIKHVRKSETHATS